jgi:hypothetical protein
MAGESESHAQDVGAGDEREEAEGPTRVHEVADHGMPVGDEPRDREPEEDHEGGGAQDEQNIRDQALALEMGADRDDAGRHDQCEVAWCEALDRPAQACSESVSHCRSLPSHGQQTLPRTVYPC